MAADGHGIVKDEDIGRRMRRLLPTFYFLCKTMARILTGIQSSGRPHLGNLLGAIVPAIRLSQQPGNESLFFIADLHSLTSIKDAATRTQNVRAVAAAWLSFGFDIEKNFL